MFGSLILLAMLPWFDTSKVKSCRYRPVYKWFVIIFTADVILLGVCGAKPAEGIWPLISLLGTAYYFAHFIVITPLIGWLERPKPVPASISEAILIAKGGKS
jgi:quinol-cytochrome oxidoreductase complex cytochrome b subunit